MPIRRKECSQFRDSTGGGGRFTRAGNVWTVRQRRVWDSADTIQPPHIAAGALIGAQCGQKTFCRSVHGTVSGGCRGFDRRGEAEQVQTDAFGCAFPSFCSQLVSDRRRQVTTGDDRRRKAGAGHRYLDADDGATAGRSGDAESGRGDRRPTQSAMRRCGRDRCSRRFVFVARMGLPALPPPGAGKG